MRRSALLFLCVLSAASPTAAEDLLPSQQVAAVEALPAALSPPEVSARLLRNAGFDGIFRKFGETLAGSARASAFGDERFLRAWEGAARKAFGRAELAEMLQAALETELGADEAAGIEGFYESAAGMRIAALEAETQAIRPELQLEAIARGQVAYARASDRRRAQIDELLRLSSAEFTFSLLSESLRGMAVGLHLSGGGDIAVPWEEIDAEVAGRLAGMKESLTDASRGVMAFTYGPLSDEELDVYLSFMRAPATQKFYGIATLVIGTTIRDTLATLGPEVAQKLAAVAI